MVLHENETLKSFLLHFIYYLLLITDLIIFYSPLSTLRTYMTFRIGFEKKHVNHKVTIMGNDLMFLKFCSLENVCACNMLKLSS